MRSCLVTSSLMLLLAQNACGGEPERTSLTLATCDNWAERKIDACRGEIHGAPLPEGAAPKLQALTLYDQCQLFDDRRQAVQVCVAEASCASFADCTMALTFDAWTPRESPNLCLAVLRRKAGAASEELGDLLQENSVNDRKRLMSSLYRLHHACEQPSVRATLADCMSLDDAGFAACIVELATEQTDVSRTQEAAQP